MATQLYIKRNDTHPSVEATLRDRNGPIDLAGATVRWIVSSVPDGTPIVNAAAEIVNAGAGTVKYTWLTGDTAVAGTYKGEFEVTLHNGFVCTFPNGPDHIAVIITPDLG